MKPEPIPGLPDDLPEGERVLWQGAPDWKSLAVHVFHIRFVALYFAVLMTWEASATLSGGGGAGLAASTASLQALTGAAAIALLCLFAWLIARSTVYTITSGRVVIRAGVALPKAVNIPFAIIGSAALNVRASGHGDIPLQLSGPDRAAYLSLWPHVRPWRLNNAQPMLRGVPDAAKAAEVLGAALAEKAGQSPVRVARTASARPAARPRRQPMPDRAAAANS
ncbi:photosynthetic complex putative assembly protein PuhB [Alkalicaulis satelles]|nr:photosynthetic complex putative assembly protein PuhB [Alkalicaulis satelles]